MGRDAVQHKNTLKQKVRNRNSSSGWRWGVMRITVVTRYLPKNPGSPLFMRDLGGQAGRGAPNQIATST